MPYLTDCFTFRREMNAFRKTLPGMPRDKLKKMHEEFAAAARDACADEDVRGRAVSKTLAIAAELRMRTKDGRRKGMCG